MRTTAAQYFHLLRRQVYTERRTPLIVFTPKEGLRLKQTRSPIDELTTGSFREVLDDPGVGDPEAVQRVVFCSGKVAWDAMSERDKREAPVAVIRVEQLYPLPTDTDARCSASPLRQCQATGLAPGGAGEHGGRGGSSRTARGESRSSATTCATSLVSSPGSPATGSKAIHDQELLDLMDETFT